MYLRSKDLNVAEQIFDTILTRFPRHPALGTVYYTLGQIYAAQGRKEEELQLYQQGVDAHVYASVLQRPMFSYPKLFSQGKPYGDEQMLAALAEPIGLLESKSAEIITELTPYITDTLSLPKDMEGLAENGEWNQLVLVRNGQLNMKVLEALPVTGAVVQKIRDEYAADMPRCSMELSVLSGNTHIKPHCGPVNYRVRLHLGLQVPADCAIRVGEETRTWEEGKVLVLDDSFEHEVS